MGLAATQFTTARNTENFKAWFAEAPHDAKTYLQTVAVKTGNVAALQAVDALENAEAAATIFAQVDAAALAATQAKRVDTLGWSAEGPPREAPALTGRLTMEGTTPVLATSIGTFNVRSINPVGANDVGAFAGRVVTVKGWPDATWAPGAGAARPTLIAEEWGPGVGHGFVTGRLTMVNGELTVQVRADKQARITDEGLKAQLLPYEKLGIVLPGEPVLENGAWLYKEAPTDFYVLGGFNLAGTGAVNGEVVSFTLQLAHGKSVTAEVPKRSWDSVTRTQRHYLYGHFESNTFKAAGMTGPAGTWSGEPSFQRGVESTKFVEHAVPVETEAFSEDEKKFGM